MGVDLQMLPFEAENVVCYSHTVLNCERRRELWDAIYPIEATHGQTVPDGFTSYLSRDEKYEEPHYGKTLTTPYGDNLQYVKAKHLKPLASHESVQDNTLNRAVWAYLACLDDEAKVALYWN